MYHEFEQLVGAAGDVQELEYISALHQTDLSEVRKDGSILAEDIRMFLSSRYGVVVDEEDVKSTILNGLGGNNSEGKLDLMELVAALLIPTLLKAVQEETGLLRSPSIHDGGQENKAGEEKLVPPPEKMLESVLKMILHDVTGSSTEPPELTQDLVRRILVAYGECELANDDTLVKEMVEAATRPMPSNDLHDSKQGSKILDISTFGQGLVQDVRLYNVRNEVQWTTNLDDVFLANTDTVVDTAIPINVDDTTAPSSPASRDEEEHLKHLALARQVDRSNTFPAIDITAGTYRSKGLMIVLWATCLVTFFAYFSFDRRQFFAEDQCDQFEYSQYDPWKDNMEAMACQATRSILTWLLLFAWMSVFGMVSVAIGSTGNGVACQEAWKPVVGLLYVLALVTVPFYFRNNLQTSGNAFLYVTSLVLGLVTCSFHGARFLKLRRKSGDGERGKGRCLPALFASTIKAERGIKHAGQQKTADMVRHAMDIHEKIDKDTFFDAHYGQALLNYDKHGKVFVKSGGFLRSWKRLLDKNRLLQEGIWIPARLLASNIVQYIVALYIVIAGVGVTFTVSANYDDEEKVKAIAQQHIDHLFNYYVTEDAQATSLSQNVSSIVGDFLATSPDVNSADLGCGESSATAEDLLNNFCTQSAGDDTGFDCSRDDTAPSFLCPFFSENDQLNATTKAALLSGAGMDEDYLHLVTREALQSATENGIDSLYPSEKYMVIVPMIVATVIAFLVAAFLATSYLPSVTTTVLRLRSGSIPTLRNKDFNVMRHANDQVAILSGSLFWGTLGASLVVGGLIATIVFLFLWQATVVFAQRFLAIIIGILVVTLIRLAIVCSCRCTMYKSFYRSRPAAANVSLLALEWANFALSAGFVFMRMIRLLLVTAVSIGRIDTPFLAPGVGMIGPINLDGYPMIHLKSILSQEAHRHPYIEQLGVIYLMKLRFSDHFAQRAGSCWRLVFVYALMPWLHRYRLLPRAESAPGDDSGRHALAIMESKHPSLRFVHLHGACTDFEQGPDPPGIQRPQFASPNETGRLRKEVADLKQEVDRLKAALSEASYMPPPLPPPTDSS